MDVLHCAIANRWVPQLSKFTVLIDDIIQAVANAKLVVVIHCISGKGRTGLVIGACLIRLGLSLEEALERLKSYHPDMLRNPAQTTFLKAFQMQTLNTPIVANKTGLLSEIFKEDYEKTKIKKETQGGVEENDHTFLETKETEERVVIGTPISGWQSSQNKEIFLAVNNQAVQFLDKKTKKILDSWKIRQLKAWGVRNGCLVLDFGSFAKDPITISTPHAAEIDALLIKITRKGDDEEED